MKSRKQIEEKMKVLQDAKKDIVATRRKMNKDKGTLGSAILLADHKEREINAYLNAMEWVLRE